MTYPIGYQNKGIKSHSKKTFDESKNYYRVFEEEGIFVTDFDPNEKSEMYEHHLRRFAQDFFDNYCSGNAFKIVEATNNVNNFKISGFDLALDYEYNARAWIDNIPVILSEDTEYLTQPITQSTLAPPTSGTRNDFVYLDVYLKELDYTDDPDLIPTGETYGVTTRLKVTWEVKVSNEEYPIHFYEDAQGLPHVTMLLAKIQRDTSNNITQSMITDMRVYTSTSPSVQTINSAPYSLVNGMTLDLNVDGASYTVTFETGDFSTPMSSIIASEIAQVINKHVPVAYAYASGNGDKVTIISRNHGIDSTIQVTGGTSNPSLNFPTSQVQGIDGNIKPKFLSKTVLEEILTDTSLLIDGEGDTGTFTDANSLEVKGDIDISSVASEPSSGVGKIQLSLKGDLVEGNDASLRHHHDSLYGNDITGINGSSDSGSYTNIDNLEIVGSSDINTVASQVNPSTGRHALSLQGTLVNGSDASAKHHHDSLYMPIDANVGLPIGSVVMWSTETAPSGWVLCNGQEVGRTGTYGDLYNVIGGRYGNGNGTTTFNLPDFIRRFPLGRDTTDSRYNNMGEHGGAEDVALTIAQMPAHSHRLPTDGTPGADRKSIVNTDNADEAYGDSTEATGSGQGHTNMPPFTVINFIIKYAYQ